MKTSHSDLATMTDAELLVEENRATSRLQAVVAERNRRHIRRLGNECYLVPAAAATREG